MGNNLSKQEVMISNQIPLFQDLDNPLDKGRSRCQDRRQPVFHPEEPPFSAIGILCMRFKDTMTRATAFIISPKLILTSARNCYDQNNVKASAFYFFPMYSGFDRRGEEVVRVNFPDEFKKKHNIENDYAVLQLARNLPQQFGTISVMPLKQGIKTQVQISGYPGNIGRGEKAQMVKKLYTQKGQATYVHNNHQRFLQTNIYTSKGQEGSPVLIFNQNCWRAIGIYSHSSATHSMATAFTRDILQKLRDWGYSHLEIKLSKGMMEKLNLGQEDVRIFLDKGIHLVNANKYQKAAHLLQNYVNWCDINSGQQTLNCALALNYLGIAYKNCGNFGEALDTLERSLKIRKRRLGPHSLQVISTLNNLGTVYLSSGNSETAMEYFDKSMQYHEKLSLRQNIETAHILSNMGLAHIDLGQRELAVRELTKSRELFLKFTGEESKEMASAHNNLGVGLKAWGYNAEASYQFRKAFQIVKKLQGPESLQTAPILANLGTAQVGLGHFPRALDCFIVSLKIRKMHQGQRSIELVKVLNNIGTLYEKLGAHSMSQNSYQQALEIIHEHMGEGCRESLEPLYNLGVSLKDEEREQQALPYLEKSYKIAQGYLGHDHKTTMKIKFIYETVKKRVAENQNNAEQ